MKADDVAAVVSVHLASFSGFFLTFMGPRFLTLFYSGICSSIERIAFVYLDNTGSVAGFVVGALNPGGFYSRLLKRYWWKFALASVVPILKKPSIIGRVARAVFHPSANPIGDDVAGLFSICVLPELQGIGAGKKLIHAAINQAKEKGCTKVFLTTDRDNNESVNTFYAKLGFSTDRQYVTHEGRRMNEYWITLTEKLI